MQNKTDEFLKEIRTQDGLKNAILTGIVVKKSGMVAQMQIVTDLPYTSEEEAFAYQAARRFLPPAFTPQVRIVKRKPDEGIIRRAIFEFMENKFPAAAAFLNVDEIGVEMLQSGANFCFDIASGEQELFRSGDVLDAVSAHLSANFCGTFYGNVRIVEKEVDVGILDEVQLEEVEQTARARFFEIENYAKIDGAETLPKYAKYIADTGDEDPNLVICGQISFLQERTTRPKEPTSPDEKPREPKTYYTMNLSDGTGTMRVTYFPKKATIEKVQQLKDGDWVVAIGANEKRDNGYMSYKARFLNRGTPPDGFVPEKRPSKPVPKFYHTVFPEEYIDYTQAGFFDDLGHPDDILNNEFVVFDLETTGLINLPSMGKMDKIIEIGAVKIKGGKIKEKFSSFVACPDKLPANIVELTGIHDEDLVGAPTVDKVLPDFFKFVDGCFLVGHNVTFDYRFIRYYGEENGYSFENREFDTCTLAQEVLRAEGLANYKLNTIAAFYGYDFNHHRAYEDAVVTAKIFLQLIKRRGSLPK